MARIARAVIIVSFCFGGLNFLAAQNLDTLHLHSRGKKSIHAAINWSAGATLIPIFVAMYPSRTSHIPGPYRGLMAGMGMICGPSAGHFYAKQWGRGFKGLAIRSAISAFWGAILLGESPRYPQEFDFPSPLSITAIIIGGGTLFGLAIYDISTVPESVRKYNESIGAMARLHMRPDLNLKVHSYGISLVYNF